MRVDISDCCIHEAARAVVYEALDIRLKRIYAEETNGVSSGMAERGVSPDDLPPALLVLCFMAGAAALLRFTPLPLERVIRKTTTDFCIALKYLPQVPAIDPKHTLERLEMAAQGFVSQWIGILEEVILGLASALQKRQVRAGHFELDGNYIHQGLAANWRGRWTIDQVTAFAGAGWAEVQKAKLSLAETNWHNDVLTSCGSKVLTTISRSLTPSTQTALRRSLSARKCKVVDAVGWELWTLAHCRPPDRDYRLLRLNM